MKRLTKKLKERIISLYHQGISTSKIAEMLNIAEHMVVKVVSPHY